MSAIRFFLYWLSSSILCCSKANSQQYFRVQPQDISVLVGENITVPCVIATPHGDVQWTKDGLALGYDRDLPAFPRWSVIGDEPSGEFNIFIQSFKLEDEGLFACEVSPYNNSPALKKVAHVRALVPPKQIDVSADSTNQILIRYDETQHHIHCRVDNARPAAHIKWFNQSDYEFPATSRVMMKDRLYSTISTLTISPSLSLHKKTFTCHAMHETLTNAMKSLQTSFQIVISRPPDQPRIHIHPSSSNYLINGTSISLSCQSSGGYPLGRLFWYRNRTLIDQSYLTVDHENLTQNNISMIVTADDNNAVYECHVTNDYLKSTGSIMQTNITLNVAFGPSSVMIKNVHDNNSTTTIVQGTNYSFVCQTSSSNPTAILVWKLNGKVLPSEQLVEIQGDHGGIILQSFITIDGREPWSTYHEKILSCEAQNPVTEHLVHDLTRLNVIYDATSIEIQGLIIDRMIRAGEIFTAECLLNDGNPPGQIQWFKGQENLSSHSTGEHSGVSAVSRVEFRVSSSDHQLPLTCQGQVANFTPHKASFLLNVTFLPETIIIVGNASLTNLSLDVESEREFECRTSPSNPRGQLKVFRRLQNGEEIGDIQYRTSSSYQDGINSIKFLLPTVDLSLHRSQLICEAVFDIESSPTTKRVIYDLIVNHKPEFAPWTRNVNVRENDSFNLTLTASGHPPVIDYICENPLNQTFPTDLLKSGQITWIAIQRNQSGIYRCTARNDIGDTTIQFNVNVEYPPNIVSTQGFPAERAVQPGSSVKLSCVIDANPMEFHSIRWFKNEHEVGSSPDQDGWQRLVEGNIISLIGKSIRHVDAGSYACEVENQRGNSRATLPLVVQYAPEIDRTDPNQQKVAVHGDRSLVAFLRCWISAIPKATVTWSRDGELLVPSKKYEFSINEKNNLTSTDSFSMHFEAVLRIDNVTKFDHAVYQCKAQNELGADILQINLTGLTVPDPPRQVQSINVSDSSIFISWISGFDGGAKQSYQLRYRRLIEDRYNYQDIPPGVEYFHLENLRSATEYLFNLRSNNSHYLSSWSEDVSATTLPYRSFSFASLFSSTGRREYSWLTLSVILVAALFIIGINGLVILIVLRKNRRSCTSSDNSSTTGTNETETNTVDLFQPTTTNFVADRRLLANIHQYPFDNYQNYEDDEIHRPFVSSYSSNNLTRFSANDQPEKHSTIHDIRVHATYATIKREPTTLPYDNLRLHNYSLSSLDRAQITYRSFKENSNQSILNRADQQAELV